ncbi:Hypothetical predicted protein [Octopus vulgaris]|uniref:Uncharacterized protein n=1 Tax=Octopus vulgaris TaxID=6645 RepID=A0AA36B8V7_OCTVU|nr:Hypothetical predicted protein [Octopus vulgaris]
MGTVGEDKEDSIEITELFPSVHKVLAEYFNFLHEKPEAMRLTCECKASYEDSSNCIAIQVSDLSGKRDGNVEDEANSNGSYDVYSGKDDDHVDDYHDVVEENSDDYINYDGDFITQYDTNSLKLRC